MKKSDEFTYFWGKEGVFSNFYPKSFMFHGARVYTSEQAFMMLKAKEFGDMKTYKQLLSAKHPAHAKSLGRKVSNYDDKRWSDVRYERMVEVLTYKFRDADLKEALLSTGESTLVEASPFDKIWGVGMAAHDPNISNPQMWKGQNLLGKALMEVRSKL